MGANGNRHGKHDEDKMNFGGMVTPEFKALATLTASITRTSMMEVMLRGIMREATAAGIMHNGHIKPEFKDAIAGIAETLRAKRDKARKQGEQRI